MKVTYGYRQSNRRYKINTLHLLRQLQRKEASCLTWAITESPLTLLNSILFFFFYTYFTLQHYIGFAIHWLEFTMAVHVLTQFLTIWLRSDSQLLLKSALWRLFGKIENTGPTTSRCVVKMRNCFSYKFPDEPSAAGLGTTDSNHSGCVLYQE